MTAITNLYDDNLQLIRCCWSVVAVALKHRSLLTAAPTDLLQPSHALLMGNWNTLVSVCEESTIDGESHV